MANYQLKYQCNFDSLQSESYTIQILQKNYTGQPINVKGGATPVLHDWQTDDPKAPVKGSSLSITLINEGSLPLESFYSIEDDEFQVILLWGSQCLFQGYLVQDDCSETMVDFTHEINLSATDNLGLLKSLSLDKADAAIAYTSVGNISFTSTSPHTLIVPSAVGVLLQPNDKIKIVGGTANGTYTAQTVTTNGNTFTIVVIEEIFIDIDTKPMLVGKLSLLDKKPLITIIGMCLQLTGLQLNTYIWGQINEVSQDQTKCFLEQTLIDPQTFLKDTESYDDCYTILTEILGAFNFTLFQALGSWHIMRWDELRYYNNRVVAYIYNPQMVSNGASLLDTPFEAGLGLSTYGETGLLQRIIRPFSFDTETFNFKQPSQLLRNYDLKILGTLLRSYTRDVWLWGGNIYTSYDEAVDASPSNSIITKSFQHIREYTATWWQMNDITPETLSYFIRVISDNIDNEVERRLVIENGNGFDYVKSYKIEACAGDTFKFSFSAKTSKYQQRSPLYLSVLIQLTDGTNTQMLRYFSKNDWDPTAIFPYVNFPVWVPINNGIDEQSLLYSYIVSIPNGNSDTEFQGDIDMSSIPIPFDGLLYVNLSSVTWYPAGINISHFKEIGYKDIRLDYTPLINSTTKITGQTHNTSQPGNVKNNNNSEIFLDSSPRNSIVGTLFLNQMIGVLQQRTVKWRHPYFPTESENLGELITFEQMFWRRKSRTIIEGTMHGLINNITLPYGLTIYINLNILSGTETATISWTSEPSGTTSVKASYFDGTWHDYISSTSPINITAGNSPFKVAFIGTNEVYYFTSNSVHFSMLSILRYSQFQGFNFVSGKQTIDYKNNKFTGTLYEIWDDGEQDSDLTDTYAFNYLYSPI